MSVKGYDVCLRKEEAANIEIEQKFYFSCDSPLQIYIILTHFNYFDWKDKEQ